MAGANLFTAYIEMGFKGFDKVDRYMKDATSSVRKGMEGINTIFNTSTNALMDFTKSANPVAFNTFGASVDLLKAQIGKEFTPFIVMASKSVQDLQGWIKSLDPETKKQIVSWTLYGVAGAGVVVVIKKIGDAFEFLSSKPLALVFLAASMAALKLCVDMDQLSKSMDRAIERGERMKKGIFTEKEFKGTIADAIVNDETMTKEQKLAKAKEMKGRLTTESHQIAKDNSNDTFFKKAGTTFDMVKGELGFENGTANDAKKMEGNNKEIKLLESAIASMEADKPIKFTKEADLPKKAGDRLKLGGLGGMAGGGGGASIGSLDNAYGNLNKLGLGQNETQQELLKMQTESFKVLQDMAGDVGDLSDILSRATGQ